MAKRVAQLYDAYQKIEDELEKLMPQQYRQSTTDSLGRTWQTAVHGLTAADDYFMDLVSLLEFKARRAAEQATANSAVVPADPNTA
jgi:hypothetical protein